MTRTYKYKCSVAAHIDCKGATGVFIFATCSACGATCSVNTCWQAGRRVPSDAPVLCEPCSGQGVLL